MCAPTPRSHHFGRRLGPLEPVNVEDFEPVGGRTMPSDPDDELYTSRGPVDVRAETEKKYRKYIGKWGINFSRTLDIADYKGWETTSAAVDAVLHYNKGARILDLQSGPGRLGEKLKEKGFSNIDAIEGDPRILSVAAKRGVYTNLIQCVVGLEDPGIPENMYDCIMTCGSFHQGNLNHNILPDLINWTKPGGFLVLNISTQALQSEYLKGMHSLIKDMKSAGKIRLISLDKHSNYGFVDTIILAFNVL